MMSKVNIRFNSRKDNLFIMIFIGTASLFSWMLIIAFIEKDFYLAGLLPMLIVFTCLVMLFWIYFGTYYVLSEDKLKWYCGPMRSSIDIASIKEILVVKTLWEGNKPATAKKGLIIKYNLYDEIYISPKTNCSFVSEILKLNDKIKITY